MGKYLILCISHIYQKISHHQILVPIPSYKFKLNYKYKKNSERVVGGWQWQLVRSVARIQSRKIIATLSFPPFDPLQKQAQSTILYLYLHIYLYLQIIATLSFSPFDLLQTPAEAKHKFKIPYCTGCFFSLVPPLKDQCTKK